MKMEKTVFRNVGIKNSGAGELPRRKKHTKTMLVIKLGGEYVLEMLVIMGLNIGLICLPKR
jgi:hypothetical protein